MMSTAIGWPNAVDRFSAVRTSVSRPAVDHLALRQDQAVREAGRDLLDVVGDQHQRRRVGIGGEVRQPRHQFLATAEIQAGRGFVEQQQFGVGHHRPGDQHALALALRQRAVGAVSRCSAPRLSRMSVARS